MKEIFEKKNSSFANMKSYLDTYLRDIGGFPSSRKVEAFFGPFRPNSYRFIVDFG
jgi:hypothetical protein